METVVYLVRHAQAVGNLLKEFNGVTDGELTAIGYLQLEALSKASKNLNIQKIYTSPLKRAYLTAQAINKNFNIDVYTDKNLIEIDCGEWENELWDVIKDKYNESYNIWVEKPHEFIPPKGESMNAAYKRIIKAILNIVSENKGKTIAIASHSAVIRCFLSYALGYEFENIINVGWGDNTNISKIIFNNELKPFVEYKYDNSHLSPEISTTAMRKKMLKDDYFVKQ